MQAEEGSDDRSLWTSRLSRAFLDALHKELDADGSRRFSARPPGHRCSVKRSHAAKGFVVLPKRWIVERTFGSITNFRTTLRK